MQPEQLQSGVFVRKISAPYKLAVVTPVCKLKLRYQDLLFYCF